MDRSDAPARSALAPLGAALLAAAALTLAGCARNAGTPAGAPAPKVSEPPITDGRSLVAAMRRKYAGAWYRTIAFTQNNTLYAASGRESRTQWIENASIPGRLRIDYLPLSSHSGLLYDGTRVHAFDNGRPLNTQPGINVPLLLTADVYVRPDSESARLLAAQGFDLARARRDTWEGKPVWVVGAAAGDSATSQFWVDAARLITVRVIQREQRGSRAVVTDTRFTRYEDVGGFPVAMEVQLRRDGRLYFREEYADVRVNPELDPAMFDPGQWVIAQPKMAGARPGSRD